MPDIAMSLSDRPFAYGPFVPHWIPRQYLADYFSFHRQDRNLVLNTTVEDITHLKSTDGWRLTLRKHDPARNVDEWWQEEFDAVVLGNGHYSVPFVCGTVIPVFSSSLVQKSDTKTGSKLGARSARSC